jgi:ferrochelatase
VVPISFVSDHVETLYEINIEAREFAEGLSIQQFHVTQGLNESPTFIRALADLVLHAVGRENSR